jgi:hypothetical protein
MERAPRRGGQRPVTASGAHVSRWGRGMPIDILAEAEAVAAVPPDADVAAAADP